MRSIPDKELHIYTDQGRVCRPLLIVDEVPGGERQQLRLRRSHAQALSRFPRELTWTQLLMDGLVELIDVEEEETTMIAMMPSDLDEGYSQTCARG